jgi:hypothetical protein
MPKVSLTEALRTEYERRFDSCTIRATPRSRPPSR